MGPFFFRFESTDFLGDVFEPGQNIDATHVIIPRDGRLQFGGYDGLDDNAVLGQASQLRRVDKI